MLRSQILITPKIDEEIRNISKNQNISQSEAVRKLLTLALGLKDSEYEVGNRSGNSDQLYDLGTYNQSNQRIDGFKEIFSVGGKTTEIKIIGDEVFRYYLANKIFPIGFEHQLLKMADGLKEYSITKTLVVRRAYVVPGLANPPGPRFIGLKLNHVLEAVKNIYDFAIDNDYHVKDKSQIVVFVHPFVDPKPITLPIKANTSLPYGGYAAPLNKEASRVEVFAVWGNNEGVQSFDAIDRYIVNTDRFIIMTKDVPQKNLMLCTTKISQSDKIRVPPDKQFEQVLSDEEILEVARVVKELTNRYGLRRTEFSFDGDDNIVFNESAKYEISEKTITKIDKKGVVKTVSCEKEIEELKHLAESDISKTIVYIDKKIIEDRAYDLLNNIAGLPTKFTVLYPGLSATSHAMRILNDFGHTALVVGNRIFKDGQEIMIKASDDHVLIEELSKSNIKNLLVNLYDARLFGVDTVGGKANNLSLLKSKGFNVPHGWVITTKFHDLVTSKKTFLMTWKKIVNNLQLDSNKKYAVRSSATVEDKLEHSYAGQFSTYLNISTTDVAEKVFQVINSVNNKRVAAYQEALGKNKPIKMAVVIQEMVDADKSGVVFGKDLQTGNEDMVVIDVSMGLGEGVVDGVAKTQRIIYSRNLNKIKDTNDGQSKIIIDKVEVSSLIEMALSVERLMGKIQDIEWAIDKQDNIWLLQSRDL